MKKHFLISLLSIILIVGCIIGYRVITMPSFYTSSEKTLLKECKINKMKHQLDNESIKKIEDLAHTIKSWGYDENNNPEVPYDYFSWEDTALSILKFSDKVVFSKEKCQLCNNRSIVDIFFKSPDRTWERLCGSAGYMKICTTCKKQLEYKCTMNS